MRVLEIRALHHPRESLTGGEWLAVSCIDVADLPLRDGHQRGAVDAVLPDPLAEVDAAADQVGLVTRLPGLGDDASFADRASEAPELLHDADAIVRAEAHTHT